MNCSKSIPADPIAETHNFFSWFKTGNSALDYMILATLASMSSYIFNWISNNSWNIKYSITRIYYYYFMQQNVVSYEGKISTNVDRYSNRLCHSSIFSDRFRSLLEYIIKNVDSNQSIREIKEYIISDKTSSVAHTDNVYMVNQMARFLISEKMDIYAVAYVTMHVDSNEKPLTSARTEHITIDLFSNKSSIAEMKQFVDDITRDYLMTIAHLRENKQFIYSLTQLNYEDSPCEQWTETVFDSTRSFNNLFFDRSNEIIAKIDFFLKNRDWYYEKGIPYTLGVGLYGPPGTGKTSFIKALANYTGRHIVSISLKLVKTKKQLESVFFENRYNTDNKKNSIDFNKKIIVFEDIDCIGDIVMDREKKKAISASKPAISPEKEKDDIVKALLMPDDMITLDDILELWDGIREAPGRIMIISSNHYADLDPALKRPGRIDITLKLTYASRAVIAKMYRHLIGEDADPADLALINDDFYTPAEIINVYMNERHGMLKRLMLNQKV